MIQNEIRSRVSVLVSNGNQFVLIFRHKNGQDYYAIPGGGIEAGEAPEKAALREIQEELGFSLENIQKISEMKNSTRHDFNFLAETSDSNFIVTGPEKNHLNNPNDLFQPQWHTRATFRRDIPIYPESAREMFASFINQ